MAINYLEPVIIVSRALAQEQNVLASTSSILKKNFWGRPRRDCRRTGTIKKTQTKHNKKQAYLCAIQVIGTNRGCDENLWNITILLSRVLKLIYATLARRVVGRASGFIRFFFKLS